MFEKYKLYNVIGAIDGCHFPFLEQPWKLPPGSSMATYFNRKGDYSINGEIFGGMDRRIYDINLGAPGSFHESAQQKLHFSSHFPNQSDGSTTQFPAQSNNFLNWWKADIIIQESAQQSLIFLPFTLKCKIIPQPVWRFYFAFWMNRHKSPTNPYQDRVNIHCDNLKLIRKYMFYINPIYF